MSKRDEEDEDDKRGGYSLGDVLGALAIGAAAGAVAVGAVLLNTPRPTHEPAAPAAPPVRPPFEVEDHAGGDDVPRVGAGIN
jgi:hypothetical protein